MLNKTYLHGRLTAVPEVRMTQSNIPVCAFTVAVKRNSSNGETDFIPCVAWRERATFIAQNFTKGQEILLEGSINNRSFTDKDGNHRTVNEVIVNNVEFCGPKGTAAYDREGNYRKPELPPSSTTFEELQDDGGELPF
jgi:single-strand DNA-binding protein